MVFLRFLEVHEIVYLKVGYSRGFTGIVSGGRGVTRESYSVSHRFVRDKSYEQDFLCTNGDSR